MRHRSLQTHKLTKTDSNNPQAEFAKLSLINLKNKHRSAVKHNAYCLNQTLTINFW